MNLGMMTKVVNRRRYNTETATVVAHDVYWDGHNIERSGRNMWLLRTPKGAYFTVTRSQWQGEQDSLRPIELDEAIGLYEGPLSEHEVSYETAFPKVTLEEA